MKRSSPPPRRSAKLEARDRAEGKVRYSTLSTRGAGLKKRNPEKQAKRKKSAAAKHRAYMRSETRRIVDARAAGRCEAMIHEDVYIESRSIVVAVRDPRRVTTGERWERCENKAKAHHHRTYARYGGKELPEDILKVCEFCHEALEWQKPAGNRFTRSRS